MWFGFVIVVQTVVIIWLLVLLGMTSGGLKKRIDRASWHLQTIDKSKEPEEPKAICGCEHHHCFHDESGCGYDRTRYSNDGTPNTVTCGCKRYTGPEPLPTVLP